MEVKAYDNRQSLLRIVRRAGHRQNCFAGVEELSRTDSQLTDIDGEALFNVEPCEGRVFVDGSTAYKGYLKERIVVYV